MGGFLAVQGAAALFDTTLAPCTPHAPPHIACPLPTRPPSPHDSEARSALVGGPLGMLGAAALFGSLASAGAAAMVGSSSAHADAAKPEIKVRTSPAPIACLLVHDNREGRFHPAPRHACVGRGSTTKSCKHRGGVRTVTVSCMHIGLGSVRGAEDGTLPNPNPLYCPCTARQPLEDNHARPAHLTNPIPSTPHLLYCPCTALQPPEDEYARPAHLSGIPKGPIVLYQVSAPTPAHLSGIPKGPIVLYQVSAPTSCLLSSPTPVPVDLPHLLAPVPTCCPTSLLFVTWHLQSPDIARTFILFTV